MKEYFSLIISAILVNNFVLSRILGICPFLGVSRSIRTSAGMGAAVIFVMTLAGLLTSAINIFLLIPYNIAYLRTLVFILAIAGLVQIVEVLLQRFSEPLYQALGIYLPLITTNCAVLGSAIICADEGYSLMRSTVFCCASAVGFALALLLFASLRERLELSKVPECLQGTPISLITAGLLAMAFLGFAGLGG
ncbi:MAG: RnfABCDGE type electron transport complex subunit A [Oligosphaeraceae bacterium]|nr:RnfABCDGE type electron transport complex subunit A [Oligosphaeraceae bacterium]